MISVPSPTKNQGGTRDPETRQTKNGIVWFLGMKVHVGTDTQGLVHSVLTTDAVMSDTVQLADLVHGDK